MFTACFLQTVREQKASETVSNGVLIFICGYSTLDYLRRWGHVMLRVYLRPSPGGITIRRVCWRVKKAKENICYSAPSIDTATSKALRYIARTKQRRTYLL